MISTKPQTIAYIVHTFDMGGLERCIARLANGLDRSRFRPIVVCLNRNGDAANWIQRDDVPIIELHKRSGNDWRVIPRLASALREHGVDVVHSHNWGTLLETTLARRLAGVPIHVHAERGMELAALQVNGFRGRMRERIGDWARRRANSVVCVAESLRDRLVARRAVKEDVIRVVPNGVDLAMDERPSVARKRIRKQLGITPDVKLIGSVGRLAPVKNFVMAVDAVAGLVRSGHDVHLVLVGAGPCRDELAARVRELGVEDKCHLVGQQSDVASWLAAMDIYINTSLFEGMSQSILEAMAAGLPMVVTEVGDNGLLVRGDEPCGRVVPSEETALLGSALQDTIENEAERRKFAENARTKHARRYSLDTMVRTYEELYTRLASGNQPQSLAVSS